MSECCLLENEGCRPIISMGWCRFKTEMADVMVVVDHEGSVTWIPPVNYLVRCTDDEDSVTNCRFKSVFIL